MQPDKRRPIVSAWRDSRRASARIYREARARPLLRLLGILAVVGACVVAWRSLTAPLAPEQRVVLLLFVGSVGLWVTEAIQPFAVGLLIIGYLVSVLGSDFVLDEPWDVSAYVNTWSSNVIWLMLGGFFLAEGLARTGLDRALLQRAVRPARGEPRRVLLATMLATAVASMFLSNTSTAALMIGAVAPLARRPEAAPFAKALLLGVPIAASVGGMGTIIGSPPNAIAAGLAAQSGRVIDFLDWMLFGVPLALALVTAAWWGLCRRFPSGAGRLELDLGAGDGPPLTGLRERLLVAGVAAATIGLWLTTPLHGIPAAAISVVPIVGLTLTQVIGVEQVRTLPWDTLMLVAGGLALGAAIVDVGLVDTFVARLAFLVDLERDWLVLGVLALVTVVLSNFMSNTAAVSVLLPVAVGLVPEHAAAACVVLGLSASCALLLPVSTPPNAIAYSTGAVEVRDFRAGGILVGLLGPALVLLWVAAVEWLLRGSGAAGSVPC